MSKFDLRRSIPIMAYVGSNGHGKSLAMIADTQSSLDYGRPVLSTVRILDYRNPRPCEDDACLFEGHPEHGAAHPSFVPLTDWSQVLEMTDCDVLLDEITSSAGSRDTSSLPSVVGDMFNQQRRSDRVVRWTAPAFGLGDIQMRRVTQGVTVCRGSFGKSVPGKLWKQNRFFHWKTYDVTGIGDELVQGLVDVGRARTRSLADVRPVVRQFFWRPGSEIERIYDTYSSVLRVGSPGEHGRCMRCGGRITVPACSCSDRPGRRRDKAEIVAGPALRPLITLRLSRLAPAAGWLCNDRGQETNGQSRVNAPRLSRQGNLSHEVQSCFPRRRHLAYVNGPSSVSTPLRSLCLRHRLRRLLNPCAAGAAKPSA